MWWRSLGTECYRIVGDSPHARVLDVLYDALVNARAPPATKDAALGPANRRAALATDLERLRAELVDGRGRTAVDPRAVYRIGDAFAVRL